MPSEINIKGDNTEIGFVNAFGCEVIMYQEVISVKCRVIYFVLTEGTLPITTSK